MVRFSVHLCFVVLNCKPLPRHHNRIITVTNESGAIPLQFHTVTDGHDHMHPAISAFLDTATEYGQALPELAATDNPLRDRKWLYDIFPML
jgi:hypothetical protein